MSKEKKLKHPKRKNYKTSEEYWQAMEAYAKHEEMTPEQVERVTAVAKDIVGSIRKYGMLSPAERFKAEARDKRKPPIKKKKTPITSPGPTGHNPGPGGEGGDADMGGASQYVGGVQPPHINSPGDIPPGGKGFINPFDPKTGRPTPHNPYDRRYDTRGQRAVQDSMSQDDTKNWLYRFFELFGPRSSSF